MTTRRVQELKERIADNQKKHNEAMDGERKKRYEERRTFEKKLQEQQKFITHQARQGRELIAIERRQSHALRSSLVQVSRPTQDYYDTIHVIIF